MITAQVVAELMAAGLSGDALIEALERIEQASHRYALASQSVTKASPGALRQRRYRERNEAKSVTKASPVTPPSLSPSPSPLTPPLSPAPLSPPIIPPTSPPLSREADRFEEFWRAYPRRAGNNSKTKAREKYLKVVRGGEDEAAIIAGAMRYAAFATSDGSFGTRFVQQATTWLNGKEWTNDYTPSRKQQSNLMDAFDRIIERNGGGHRVDDEGAGARPSGNQPPFTS